jgi:glycosyltransferase involved in cell wall biosynthesis
MSQGDMVREILIIDGGSSDGSLDGVSSLSVSVLGGHGVSLVDAWNIGLYRAAGEWLAFLDSDDVWLPGALASQFRALHADGADLVSGRVAYVCDEDPPPPQLRRDLLTSNPIGWMPGSTMARTFAARGAGHFRKDLGLASDIEWIDRLRSTLRWCLNDSVVLRKRVTSTSVSMRGSQSSNGRSALSRDLLSMLRQRVAKGPSAETSIQLKAHDQ